LSAFAWDFVPPIFLAATAQNGVRSLVVEYLPFAVMYLAAPLLVLAATARSWLQVRYRGVTLGPVVD
jgi:hypothetical protein